MGKNILKSRRFLCGQRSVNNVQAPPNGQFWIADLWLVHCFAAVSNGSLPVNRRKEKELRQGESSYFDSEQHIRYCMSKKSCPFLYRDPYCISLNYKKYSGSRQSELVAGERTVQCPTYTWRDKKDKLYINAHFIEYLYQEKLCFHLTPPASFIRRVHNVPSVFQWGKDRRDRKDFKLSFIQLSLMKPETFYYFY